MGHSQWNTWQQAARKIWEKILKVYEQICYIIIMDSQAWYLMEPEKAFF